VALVSQLPSPVMLVGDFNAHNSLWESTTTDKIGLEIVDFILQSNLCLMNTKDNTYIHPATGTRSSIDLYFCDPTFFTEYVWSLQDDQCRSEHFPIVLSTTKSMPVARPWKFQLAETDWSSFVQMCELELDHANLDTAADPFQAFSAYSQ
jgi:hypothetical protein